jgi:hypothetical protein
MQSLPKVSQVWWSVCSWSSSKERSQTDDVPGNTVLSTKESVYIGVSLKSFHAISELSFVFVDAINISFNAGRLQAASQLESGS